MELGIQGKVALITGGSRGLGKQSAISLAKEGARVVICARTQEGLDNTVTELKKLYGSIDILINNAGGSRRGNIVSTTDEDWSSLVDLNLMSAIHMSRLVIPDMQSAEWGRIINIASIWGREHGGGVAYMTTKAALIALTKNTALTYAKDGILVNCVAPGSISFPGGSWDKFQQNQKPEDLEKFIEQNLPMGKFGWPEPVGDLVAYLSSNNAGILTGACINIDGGQSRSLI
jgi:3-oxoacyl-[acyl-carrier protein] reductase